MTYETIKNRSIPGIKWTTILTLLSMPAAYLMQILLARVTPEALGTYSVLTLYLSILFTFAFFGGSSVLSNFLPKIEEKRKLEFILSYSVIILGLLVMLSIFITLFSNVLKKSISDTEYAKDLFPYLLLLGPLFITYKIMESSLYGIMKLKAASILNRLQPLVLCMIVSIGYICFIDILKEKYSEVILISVLITYLSGVVYGPFSLIRSLDIKKSRMLFYLPRGFWNFAIFVYLSKLVVFFYGNIDRIFVLKSMSLSKLGYYQSVYSLFNSVRQIPISLTGVLIPSFSLLIHEDLDLVPAYDRLAKSFILFSFIAGMVLMSFSREILSLFGEEYIAYSGVLNFYALIIICSAMGYINIPILRSFERNKELFIGNVIQIFLFQLVLSIFLAKKLGIWGVVLPKGIGLGLIQVYQSSLVVYRLNRGFKIPKGFFWAVLLGIVIFTFSQFITMRLIMRCLLLIGMLALFLSTNDYKMGYLKSMFHILKK